MMRKMRKPLSLALALMMCLSMVTGIILPEIAEAPTANAVADPYQSITDNVVLLEKSNGTVTVNGNTVTVPEKYADMDIFAPNDRVLFYDPNWTTDSTGEQITVDENGYFMARYGDGSEWGNGKVYLMQWGVNAFGAVQQKASTSSVDGSQILAAGAHSGFSDISQIIRHYQPEVGKDNKFYVLLFPGLHDESLNDNGGNNHGVTHKAPTPAEGKTESDLVDTDYTSVYFYGPQAGVDPTSPVVGDTRVQNNRSASYETEFVMSNTIWGPIDANWYFDGVAAEGGCRIYVQNDTELSGKVSTMSLSNMYCHKTLATQEWLVVGHNNYTNGLLIRFYMKDVYVDGKCDITEKQYNFIQANDAVVDNVVVTGINYTYTGTDKDKVGAIYLRPSAPAEADKAFLGNYRNGYNFVMRSSTLNYSVNRMFVLYGHDGFSDMTGNKNVLIENNHFKTYKEGFYSQENGLSTSDRMAVTVKILNNRIEGDRAYAAENKPYVFYVGGGYYADNNTTVITGNTVVATPGEQFHDIYSTDKLLDLSGNLFITHGGLVRVPRISYSTSDTNTINYAKVTSDVYASAAKDCGVKDLFVPQQTADDLLITNAHIQSVILSNSAYNTTFGTDIVGALTVLPEADVEYDATKLFTFKDEGVKFIGTFKEKICNTPVTTLQKGFGTVYAKAVYETEFSKAVVVYIVKEFDGNDKDNVHIVDPENKGTYTFNGTTYTSDNANFHSTVESAVASYTQPETGLNDGNQEPASATDIILLMPGTYGETTISKGSVALIGPGFGSKKDPTKSGSKAIENGRGADATKEAVFTGTLSFDVPQYFNNYYTVAGISATYAATNTDGVVPAVSFQNGTSDIINFINLQNNYISGALYITQTGTQVNGGNLYATTPNRCVVYMNDSVLCNTGTEIARNYWVNASHMTWRDCTVIPNNISENQEAGRYVPTNPTKSLVAPKKIGMYVEGCTFADAKSRIFNITEYRHMDKADFADHPLELHIVGNHFLDCGNVRLIETYAEKDKRIRYTDILFKNNYLFSNTKTDLPIIEDQTDRYAQDKGELVVTGNIFHNYTQPVVVRATTGDELNDPIVREKTCDINENYFGDADCGVLKITTAEPVAFDGTWYYVNEKQTVKSSDIALTKGGFNAVDIDDGLVNFTAKLTAISGRVYTKDDFSVKSKQATVLGIFTDSACENNVDSITYNGGEQKVYVRVKMDNYIATWTATITLANVWVDAGLTPTTEKGVVSILSQAEYQAIEGARAGNIVFIAHDWARWAYGAYDETTGTLSDPFITNLSKTQQDGDAVFVEENLKSNYEAPEYKDGVMEAVDSRKGVVTGAEGRNDTIREIKVGQVFYAQMPTTGVVYKLKYGETAINSRQLNPRNAATAVFFPGYYNKTTGYDANGMGDSLYSDPLTNEEAHYAFAMGYGNDTADIKDFLVLGPQAGMPAGNTENGTLRGGSGLATKYATIHAASSSDLKASGEAVLAGNMAIFVMNHALRDGATFTVDGIMTGWSWNLTTAGGSNGSNMYNSDGTATINLKNIAHKDINADNFGLYNIYPHNANVTADDSVNTTTLDIELNVDRCCYDVREDRDAATVLGKLNVNRMNVTNSVFVDVRGTGTYKVPTSDTVGFYIAPPTGQNLTRKVDISYKASNNYVDWKYGYLFGIYLNGTNTINSTTRNKLELDIRDNYFENVGKATANASRASIATLFSDSCTEQEVADAYAITTVSMTGNTVKNTEGAYPKYGYLLYNGSKTQLPSKTTVEKNTIIGYKNLFRNFEGDFCDNIYMTPEGKFVSAPGYDDRITGSNIVLNSTYTRFATDFDVKAGMKLVEALDWTGGLADIHADARVIQEGALTGADIKTGVMFAGKDVVVSGLYQSDGVTEVGDDEKLTIGKNYRLIATYADDPYGARAVYNILVEDIPGTTVPMYDGPNKYLDPDVKNIDYGTLVERELDGKKYQFMVGRNIFATIEEFPVYEIANHENAANINHVRKVYLFAKTYFENERITLPNPDGTYVTEFFGVKKGISAVQKDANGKPTGERSAERRDITKETVFKDAWLKGEVRIDGVAFAGKTYIEYSKYEGQKYAERYAIINCTTDPENPLALHKDSAGTLYNKAFSFNDARRKNVLVHDNYFQSGEKLDSLMVVRNGAEISVYDNAYHTEQSSGSNMVWFGVGDANGTFDAEMKNEELLVTNNFTEGKICIDDLQTARDGLAIHMLISNNEFVMTQTNCAIYMGNYRAEGSNVLRGKDIEIEIVRNTFDSVVPKGSTPSGEYIFSEPSKLTAANGESAFKLFHIDGNTFTNSAQKSVGYAVFNQTDTVWDVSRNTFIGFDHNYGNRSDDVSAAANDKGTSKAASETGNIDCRGVGGVNYVKFAGLGEATFIIDGVTYKANTKDTAQTVANATASGVAATEDNKLTDIATADAGWTYEFRPANGMMVKITSGNNTYWNAIPIPMNNSRNNCKITFTAQLTNIAGETFGDSYTVTAYADPLAFKMETDKCAVTYEADSKVKLHWDGRIMSQHATYLTDLLNRSNFRVTGYGMYTSTNADEMTAAAIKQGLSKATKRECGYNADGLDTVPLDYSIEYTEAMPAETTAHYCRMYITYKVGEREYIGVGALSTLTVYVAN